MPTNATRDVGSRLRLTARTIRDAGTRFRLLRARDYGTRYVLTVRTAHGVGSRLRLNVPPAAPTIQAGTPSGTGTYQKAPQSLVARSSDTVDATRRIAYEWGVSRDSGSSWAVIGTSPAATQGTDGTLAWNPVLLADGSARLRVRALADGAYSGYTSQSSDFTLAPLPTASPTAPDDGAAVAYASSIGIAWAYNGPGTQSAWRLRRRPASGGTGYTWWNGSSWQATEVGNSGAGTTATIGANAWSTARGERWRWAIAVDDGHGYGPYSDERELITSASEAPTITAPSGTVAASPFTVTWTVPASQTRYRVRVLKGASFDQLVYDSGIVADAAARSQAVGPLGSGATHRFEVTAWNAEGLAATSTTDRSVSYSGPNQPTIAATAVGGNVRPYVDIAITNPGGGVSLDHNEVWRAADDVANPYELIGTAAANATFRDDSVAPGRAYFYFVRAVGASTFTDSANSG